MESLRGVLVPSPASFGVDGADLADEDTPVETPIHSQPRLHSPFHRFVPVRTLEFDSTRLATADQIRLREEEEKLLDGSSKSRRWLTGRWGVSFVEKSRQIICCAEGAGSDLSVPNRVLQNTL